MMTASQLSQSAPTLGRSRGQAQSQALRSRRSSSRMRSTSRSHRSLSQNPRTLRSAHPQGNSGWIEALQVWQRTSTILALLSCSTVLGIYSWTVYTQERWNQQYEALQQMRRHERQFLLTQESISNSLRDTAARSDMVPLVPERMIEVPIASPRDDQDSAPQFQPRSQQQQEQFFPVGY